MVRPQVSQNAGINSVTLERNEFRAPFWRKKAPQILRGFLVFLLGVFELGVDDFLVRGCGCSGSSVLTGIGGGAGG